MVFQKYLLVYLFVHIVVVLADVMPKFHYISNMTFDKKIENFSIRVLKSCHCKTLCGLNASCSAVTISPDRWRENFVHCSFISATYLPFTLTMEGPGRSYYVKSLTSQKMCMYAQFVFIPTVGCIYINEKKVSPLSARKTCPVGSDIFTAENEQSFWKLVEHLEETDHPKSYWFSDDGHLKLNVGVVLVDERYQWLNKRMVSSREWAQNEPYSNGTFGIIMISEMREISQPHKQTSNQGEKLPKRGLNDVFGVDEFMTICSMEF